MLLEPDGADYAEIVNYTVSPHPTYPTSTEYFSVGETSGDTVEILLALDLICYT